MIYMLENELRNSARAIHALNCCAISPASIFLTLLIWMNTFWNLAKISFYQIYFFSMLEHCYTFSNDTLSFSISTWLHLSTLLSFYFVHHDILRIHTWILGHKLLEFDLRCQNPSSECYWLSGTWQNDKNNKKKKNENNKITDCKDASLFIFQDYFEYIIFVNNSND